MSQRNEKYMRKALKQYDSIAQDVDRLNMEVPYMGQQLRKTEERLERRIRNERSQRRSEGRAARWALVVALVDLAGLVLMTAVLV